MAIKWKRVSKSRYWEMLEVLPPAVMGGDGFMVGEPFDHDPATGQPRFEAFIGSDRAGYFVASEPMTIKDFRAILPGVADYAYSADGQI